MGPAPGWMYLLVDLALVVDDVALFVWLGRRDEYVGRGASRLAALGAAMALAGQGLEYATKDRGWPNDLAWASLFLGLIVLLAGAVGLVRAGLVEHRLERGPITDPVEYARRSQQTLAYLCGPLSLGLPKVALSPRLGLVGGILLLILAIGMPWAFRQLPSSGSE